MSSPGDARAWGDDGRDGTTAAGDTAHMMKLPYWLQIMPYSSTPDRATGAANSAAQVAPGAVSASAEGSAAGCSSRGETTRTPPSVRFDAPGGRIASGRGHASPLATGVWFKSERVTGASVSCGEKRAGTEARPGGAQPA
eukprot:scaffold5185_cov110-Isochrysis_galbana.AAC.7